MDWLARYLLPDSPKPEWEYVHGTPTGTAFVTDDRCLLAVTLGPADAPPADIRPVELLPQPRLHKTLALLDAQPPADAIRTDLHDLWLWLDVFWRVRCPVCRGEDAESPARRFCQECDGEAWVVPLPDPNDADTVTLCGYPFDRNRLAWWLAGELEGLGTDCRVWTLSLLPAGVRRDIEPGLLAVAGDRWRLVAAAMARDAHPARYRTYLPGAGVWYSCRRCPVARLSGADWAQERGADGYDLFGVHEETML